MPVLLQLKRELTLVLKIYIWEEIDKICWICFDRSVVSVTKETTDLSNLLEQKRYIC